MRNSFCLLAWKQKLFFFWLTSDIRMNCRLRLRFVKTLKLIKVYCSDAKRRVIKCTIPVGYIFENLFRIGSVLFGIYRNRVGGARHNLQSWFLCIGMFFSNDIYMYFSLRADFFRHFFAVFVLIFDFVYRNSYHWTLTYYSQIL